MQQHEPNDTLQELLIHLDEEPTITPRQQQLIQVANGFVVRVARQLAAMALRY